MHTNRLTINLERIIPTYVNKTAYHKGIIKQAHYQVLKSKLCKSTVGRIFLVAFPLLTISGLVIILSFSGMMSLIGIVFTLSGVACMTWLISYVPLATYREINAIRQGTLAEERWYRVFDFGITVFEGTSVTLLDWGHIINIHHQNDVATLIFQNSIFIIDFDGFLNGDKNSFLDYVNIRISCACNAACLKSKYCGREIIDSPDGKTNVMHSGIGADKYRISDLMNDFLLAPIAAVPSVTAHTKTDKRHVLVLGSTVSFVSLKDSNNRKIYPLFSSWGAMQASMSGMLGEDANMFVALQVKLSDYKYLTAPNGDNLYGLVIDPYSQHSLFIEVE